MAESGAWGERALIAVGALGILGALIAVPVFMTSKQRTAAAQEEAAITAMPQRSIMLGALQREFPAEYEDVVALVREVDKSGMNPDAARDRVDARIMAIINSKLPLAVNGSDASLAAMPAPQLAYFEYLRKRDVAMCARYGTQGLTADDRARLRGSSGVEFDQAVTAAMLHAAHDGAVNGGRSRWSGQMRPSTGAAIVAQLHRDGVSPTLIATMTSAAGLDRAPASQQCDGSVAIVRAVGSLGPAVTADYYRSILSANAAAAR